MTSVAASTATSTASSLLSSCFRRHLFATNLFVSFSISGLGDFLQQKYEAYEGKKKKDSNINNNNGNNNNNNNNNSHSSSKPAFKWNVYRSFHMSATYGLTSGVLCHYWYNILDKFVPGAGLRVAFRKIFIDQVLFSPICIGSCLLVDSAMEGHSAKRVMAEVATKGYYLYLADCLVWPPAQFVNFYFLPTRFRVAFDNLVSLGVDVYTSHVKHQVHVPGDDDDKGEKKEEEEQKSS